MDNPHIAAQPSAYVRADNQRIPRRTISGLRADFCECKTKITQSIDIRAILATCFSILQPVVVHEVRLLVSAIFNPNLHRRCVPACMENSRLPAQNPHPPARKFRGPRAENPRCSAQLSAGVRVEQAQNSSKKLRFPCHVAYVHL